MEYLLIFIAAIFVNNIVLSQFLGICPFLGVSQKVNTSLGMSAAVAFVMLLATLVTWLIQTFILNPFDLGYPTTVELDDGSLLTVFYAHIDDGKQYDDVCDGSAVVWQQRWKFMR